MSKQPKRNKGRKKKCTSDDDKKKDLKKKNNKIKDKTSKKIIEISLKMKKKRMKILKMIMIIPF